MFVLVSCSLRAIVRCQGQLVILKLFSRLADFIQRCNNAKGMVQSFQVMFEELHSRISSPQDEESATLILNSVIAKMLDSLRPVRGLVTERFLVGSGPSQAPYRKRLLSCSHF
jgi:hypothetical protein